LKRLVLILSLLCFASAVMAAECESADGTSADASEGQISSWSGLHASFALYKNCDDGALAEIYDGLVEKLLTKRWRSVPALTWQVNRDPAFLTFVLRHIDMLWSDVDTKIVAISAAHRCPTGSTPTCSAILARLRELDAEASALTTDGADSER
jgi:hypothetical protein